MIDITLAILTLIASVIAAVFYTKYRSLKVREEEAKRITDETITNAQAFEKQVISLEEALKNRPTWEEKEQLIAKVSSLEASLKEQAQANASLEERLRDSIKNLSNEILHKQTSDFKQSSAENLAGILNPLKEDIDKFRNLSSTQSASLKTSIDNLMLGTKEMQSQAEDLTNALKGDSKKQGNWGEIKLEIVLENAGLEEDKDYIREGRGLEFKSDEGGHFKPDVTILLPDNKKVFVDAKVTLDSLTKYYASELEEDQQTHLKSFFASIKNHAESLKKYLSVKQKGQAVDTPESILMFIPIESAYSLLAKENQELIQTMWRQKIAIVSPNTLMIILHVISSLWKLEKRNKNIEKIASRGEEIYKKANGVFNALLKVGDNISTTQKSYDTAMNRLKTGQGSLVRQAEMLKELGAGSDKKLVIESEKTTNP